MSQKQPGTGANPFGSRTSVSKADVPVVNTLPQYPLQDQLIWGTSFQWGAFKTVAFPLVLHEATDVGNFRLLVGTPIFDYLQQDLSGYNTVYRAVVAFNDTSPDAIPMPMIPMTLTSYQTTVAPRFKLGPGNYVFLIGFFLDAAGLTSSTISTYNGVPIPESDDPGQGIVGWWDAWAGNPGMLALTLF